MKNSPRQELRLFAGAGDLRSRIESSSLSPEAVQLCIDIVLRYCEYTPKRKRK